MKIVFPNAIQLIALAGLLLSASGTGADTIRVSVDSGGNEIRGTLGAAPTSGDGRFVTFRSAATNLVPGDTNTHFDIFVRDRQGGAVSRVNVDSAGGQANSSGYYPTISADGRFVGFQSDATNLVPGDTNNAYDIFVHDRQSGVTSRVNVDSAGTQANANSFSLSISADGRFVAFDSEASNLVAGDTNNQSDVFVHDRQSGVTSRVSVGNAGTQANLGSFEPSISANGRFIAFQSNATALVAGDTNNAMDIFVHDRQSRITTRVSVDSAGLQTNGPVIVNSDPSISGDGRFVAFQSNAPNLVAGDTNYFIDIFVHDRQTAITSRVNVDSAGSQANRGSYNPTISADGRFVGFQSDATALVGGDTNNQSDIFVHDRQNRTTTRVSVDNLGDQANGGSYTPFVSADGRFVAFNSEAGNLVPGDTNLNLDIFIRELSCVLDADCDGVTNISDNCLNIANGPAAPDAGGRSQRDTNNDGFGNVCDADLNNDGRVTIMDYMLLRRRSNSVDADLNGDGRVTINDSRMLRNFFNKAPGPSGLRP